jgi:pSer/pThr/pTyr-binding forkhead associated (FHA) protein
MASLRLKFPEKEEPSVIALSGSRVTLGRLPLNTIQIIDRTLSGFHAEFVLEEDHYRLHDRGSTNGTFVNGETVTDFHLREACKISFGALECEYRPESPAPEENSNVEALPTRSEINAVRQENTELKTRVESTREELEALRKTSAAEAGHKPAGVAQEEHDKVLAERDALKETQLAAQKEIEQLKAELASLQRDRENLKKVTENAKAEFALEAEAIALAAPVPVEEKVAAKAEPAKEEATPAAPPPPPVPVAPPTAPIPATLPKPSLPLPTARPMAKPPGPLPAAPVKLPVTPGSGLRPAPVAPSSPTAKPLPTPLARPVATPAASAAPTGAPALKPLLRPLPKAPAPPPKGGTQKIDADAVQPVKPVMPTAKLPMKPPVRLPLQPTVKLQSGLHPRPNGPLPTSPNKPADKENDAG